MGSKDSKPPPTWEDVIQYAEAFSYKPLDIIKMVHDKTKIKTKVEVFIIYGLIHRLLETVKPKKIKSDNHMWFLKRMPEGTTLTLGGIRYKTKSWRTNETYLHFVIAHYESEKMLSKMYDDYCKKYEKQTTSNIFKTLYRGYSEAMLDLEKREIIKQWSIPVEPLPPLK
jgi:hypothetical protein